MNEQEIIALYEGISEATTQMLAAVQEEDWERLSALEVYCSRQIDILKSHEPLPPLHGALREKKIALIKDILSDDSKIRNLTQPWLKKLSMLINHTHTERKVQQTYGMD